MTMALFGHNVIYFKNRICARFLQHWWWWLLSVTPTWVVGFQPIHMEHVVHAERGRQSQTVCHVSHPLRHAIWPYELGGQFA